MDYNEWIHLDQKRSDPFRRVVMETDAANQTDGAQQRIDDGHQTNLFIAIKSIHIHLPR